MARNRETKQGVVIEREREERMRCCFKRRKRVVVAVVVVVVSLEAILKFAAQLAINSFSKFVISFRL